MKQKRVITIGSLINKLKNGFELLSPFVGHPVASILSLGAGVAGLYIAFNGDNNTTKNKDDSSEIVYYVAGLQNLGNNCFLNVILQALASCPSFVSYIENVLESDKTEEMPLVFSLTSLLQELSIIRAERTILNPHKLMQSLSLYVSNFNLTRQQDAAEAFLHLLTSLKSEILHNYVPHGSTTLNITDFSSRVYNNNQNMIFGPNLGQWRNNIFGPFNGTIQSTLTCVTCSSVLSMDYEHFDCLSLSPVLDINGDIMNGCNIIDCLKHYTKIELLENYKCDKCWHIKALNYLSQKSDQNEEKNSRLISCVNYDNCTCETIFHKEEITWSSYSHAFKQLSVNPCPKILCVHLQRALMNTNGEFIKHQGHISFPFDLDLSPFIKSSSVPKTQYILNIFQNREIQPQNNQKNENKSFKYALCSVIEHYGRYGGGHYAAYRKAPPVQSGDLHLRQVKESRNCKWFYVSDRDVSEVLEDVVLSAEASLLFYELI